MKIFKGYLKENGNIDNFQALFPNKLYKNLLGNKGGNYV